MSLIPRLLLCLALLSPAPVALADDAQSLQSALRLALGKDWDAALAAAPAGVGRDVILWQKLRDGKGSLGEYEDFLSRRADWPGLPFLKEKGEEAAARSTTPSRVIAYFGSDLPQTALGAIALVQALKADGQTALAETEAMRAWAELSFTAEEETALLLLEPEALAFAHKAAARLGWSARGRTPVTTGAAWRIPRSSRNWT